MGINKQIFKLNVFFKVSIKLWNSINFYIIFKLKIVLLIFDVNYLNDLLFNKTASC